MRIAEPIGFLPEYDMLLQWPVPERQNLKDLVRSAAGGTAEFANPDVEIVGTDVEEFPAGLARLAECLRRGQLDTVRLWDFAERRYGHTAVAAGWTRAILTPGEFFHDPGVTPERGGPRQHQGTSGCR